MTRGSAFALEITGVVIRGQRPWIRAVGLRFDRELPDLGSGPSKWKNFLVLHAAARQLQCVWVDLG